MPFSHFRGGLKPPLPCGGGFTLNRFFPPVDGLRHRCYRKPFTICSCEKRARNSPAICSCKSLDLNFPGINSYKKQGGGHPLLASDSTPLGSRAARSWTPALAAGKLRCECQVSLGGDK